MFSSLIFKVKHLKSTHQQLRDFQRVNGGSMWWWRFAKAYLIHGCYINQYIYGEFFRLTPAERKASLTYPRFEKVLFACNPREHWHYLQNKKEFNTHFAPFVNRHWLYVPEADYDTFVQFVQANTDLLVKPYRMFMGKGIHRFIIPKDPTGMHEVYETLRKNECLLEERIHQHPVLTLGAQSVNTVRAYTVIDKDGTVHLLKTVFRGGVGDSVVDNFHAGGCIYAVDLDTGVIVTPGMQRTADGKRTWHKIHPGTDTMMIGFKIPNWEILKTQIVEAARSLPQCRYVGWDIAITQDGIELIEGNEEADYELLEFVGEKGWWSKIKKMI